MHQRGLGPCLDRVEQVASGARQEEGALLPVGRPGAARQVPGPGEAGGQLVGIHPQCIGERGHAVLLAPQREERLRPAGVPLGQVGIEGDRLVELRQRRPGPAIHAECDSQPGAGLGEVGSHLQRVLEGDLGAFPVAGGEVRVPAADLLECAGMGRRGEAGERERCGEDGEAAEHVPVRSERRAGSPRRNPGVIPARSSAGRTPGARRGPGRVHGAAIDTTCVVT